MTIAGHSALSDLETAAQSLWGLVSQEPDPFWDEVKRSVATWLVISAIAGVGYMAIQIPSRLERVLINQDAVRENVRELQQDFGELKQRIETVEVRLRHE